MAYGWVRVEITTKNRDRKGGHDATWATDGMGYKEPYTPRGAKLLKRKTRRAQRRQHQKVTREAVKSFYEEASFDVLDTIEIDEFQASMYELAREYEQDDRGLDWDDDPLDPLDYWGGFDPCEDDPYFYTAYGDHYRDNILTKDGLTSLAHNATLKVENHIIDHTDAGKSLGELLEEMLARGLASELNA